MPVRAPERPAPTSLESVLASFQPDLEAVTQRLFEVLGDPVARSVTYLISAGGKRLRPALVLLAGRSGPSPNQAALIDAATAVELIHTATLVHDDIIDRAALRRRQTTFHHRWGTERAVLMGDYLYATAFTLLTRAQRPEVVQVMADVCQQLARGELREVEARFRLDLTEGEYLSIIGDKTASLIEGSCRAGALLGGHAPAAVDAWGRFGANFGLAFQIIDDCLDLVGDVQELGKAIHTDLDKGAVSLPIIYLARLLTPSARRRLFGPLQRRDQAPAALRRIARIAAARGAVQRARRRAVAFGQDAQQAVAAMLDGIAGAVDALTHYAVTRRS